MSLQEFIFPDRVRRRVNRVEMLERSLLLSFPKPNLSRNRAPLLEEAYSYGEVKATIRNVKGRCDNRYGVDMVRFEHVRLDFH